MLGGYQTRYCGKILDIHVNKEICVEYSGVGFIIVSLYENGAIIADYDAESDLYDYDHSRWICKEDLERYVYEDLMER